MANAEARDLEHPSAEADRGAASHEEAEGGAAGIGRRSRHESASGASTIQASQP